MKVLIDISENRYKVLQDFKEAGCGLGYLEKAVLQGVVISDNATNGDMIKENRNDIS